MSTPTASGNPAKAAVLQNVATPQPQAHLPSLTSPAPRSVPSPAAHRTQAGKSPFPFTTQGMSNPPTVAAQNYPTVGSSGSASKTLLGSSPAGAMVNFESPLGMGFSLSQMANGEGGVPMVSGMSGGFSGLGLMGMNGTSEEERMRRLQEVVDKLRSRPGRVGRRNIVTLAERLGFDMIVGEPNRQGISELSVAGRNVLLDIRINARDEVLDAKVEFLNSSPALEENAITTSEVLRRDLVPPSGKASITLMLDKFAANLEKLSKIDKPTGTNAEEINCFEAISGVYRGLHKLFDHERGIALQMFGDAADADAKARMHVLCKKSGVPKMNEDGRIGLNVDYWVHQRHIKKIKPPESTHSEDGVFSLSIHCEPFHAGQMVQPARISDAWLSDRIFKTPEESVGNNEHSIDWLEPPSTYIPLKEGEANPEAAISAAGQKLPNVRFVARLRPPLVLPASIAVQGGVSQEHTFLTLPSYVTSLFMQTSGDAMNTIEQQLLKEFHAERSVISRTGLEEIHFNTLRLRNVDQAILLQEIPFDHPKQLVQMLPASSVHRPDKRDTTDSCVQLLRQFALTNTLLKTSFPQRIFQRAPANPNRKSAQPSLVKTDVEFTLRTVPNPKLAITFARPSASRETHLAMGDINVFMKDDDTAAGSATPIALSLTILPNADIKVDLHAEQTDAADPDATNQKLVGMIDFLGDLDVWVEAIKRGFAA